jgi:hypothetical protein
MKGKVLSIITAILFGATMMACPIVGAATTEPATGTEVAKPAPKAKTKTAKAKKKKAPKTTAKKKGAKKKTEPKAEPKTTM